MDTCGLCFGKCGWHEPNQLCKKMDFWGSTFQLNSVQSVTGGAWSDQSLSLRMTDWVWLWREGALYESTAGYGLQHEVSLVFCLKHLYYTSDLQLCVVVKCNTTSCVKMSFILRALTKAQCSETGVDGCTSCCRDQTCDLSYDNLSNN